MKKLSAAQKRLKIEYLAKNRMHKHLAYVYVEIVAIPLKAKNPNEEKLIEEQLAEFIAALRYAEDNGLYMGISDYPPKIVKQDENFCK